MMSISKIPILLCGLAVSSFAAGPPITQDFYQKQVFPVLEKYCYDCHADGVTKGDLALDEHKDYASLLADRDLWEDVREHVSTHVMPPENKLQPASVDREKVLRWIDDAVFYVDPAKADPGHITLRRLNRTEYNNTVRDIFRVDSRPGDGFPPDDSGYGFDNIGDVLSLSPMLMEKYMKAARKVAEEAVWTKPFDRFSKEREGGAFWVAQGKGDVSREDAALFTNGELSTNVDVPADGIYRVAFELSAQQAGAEKAKYELRADGQQIGGGDVSTQYDPAKPGENMLRMAMDVPLKAGRRRISVLFLNDAGDPTAADPKMRDRNLFVHGVTVGGPLKFRAGGQSRFLDWLFDGKALSPDVLVLEGADFDADGDSISFDGAVASLASESSIHRKIELPVAGEYVIRLRCYEDHAGPEYSKLKVQMGTDTLGIAEVTALAGKPKEVSFKKTLPAGSQELRVSFLNDYYKDGKDRNAYVERVTVTPSAGVPSLVTSKDGASRWITRLGTKAFRRPLDAEERDRLAAMVEAMTKDGASAEEAVALVCEALLSSPKFLFIGGASGVGKEENGSVLVDEFALASRLSYFLWSSTPDDELMKLATEGKLRSNLPAQVTRMIGDWRAQAMAENFAGQWLQLRDIELVQPNPRRFPEFQGGLASAMKRESQMFFDHILRENRSVMEFLDSDYTFANEKLAAFYGIKGVKGKDFKKVSLAGTHRGGILTQAGILTLTSLPTRTSPVKRGKYVLEQILGTPPPPPPQNVPPIPEGRELKGTLRQKMEEHRKNPACAACHAFLDPMGFAFEHYDAIGRWREKDNGEAIDSTGKLITGQSFDGAETLRKVLAAERSKDFIRCLSENLLVYSLGRGLNYMDKPAKDSIIRRAEERGYKFQEIILAVCESVPFQRMRAADAKQVSAK